MGLRPDLSVIIPVYNRGTLIRHTLASVRLASTNLTVEIIVVDDGSTPPLEEVLPATGHTVEQLIRQPNQGLLFARLTGLAAATGRYVLFLDSDDLVSADKLSNHVAAMDAAQADISYSDSARQALDDTHGPVGSPTPDAPLQTTADSATFLISVQPAPHSPVFATDYLRIRVAAAPFPPSPLYNPVAEIWFYHICAPFPARVLKISSGLALVGQHAGTRLTNHWENLGVASLAVMEAFARTCPADAYGRHARALVAAKAFGSWRRLPRGFSPEFSSRLLALWRYAPDRRFDSSMGGSLFRLAARLLGPVGAGHLFRFVQAAPYAAYRTMEDATFTHRLAALPPP